MTGMIVLDVVIGLIFIYLFYSLFCTIIVEIIATNFGLRARNLKISIIRILSDNAFSNKETRKAFWRSDFFPEQNSLAKSFYESPIIKYLGFSDRFKKPAWIGNETFVDGIFSILENQGNTLNSVAEKIKDFFENPQGPFSQTETFKQLKFYFDKSNGDLDRFRENLSLWYDEIGERATGWYKKRIQVILFLTGLIVATGFNVDTIEIATKLSIDKDARQYFIEASEKLKKDSTTEEKIKTNAILNQEGALDSMFKQSYEIQSILSMDRCKKDSWVDSWLESKCEKCIQDFEEKSQMLADSTNRSGSEKDSVLSIQKEAQVDPGIDKSKQLSLNAEVIKCHWMKKYFWSGLLNFLGCLITAFAISLGSPFWFDLLNKFMQLRGSVARGATTEKKKLTNKTENGEPIKG